MTIDCFSLERNQRGVSLVELMVSTAIGLVILMALGYFFLGSQQVNRTFDDVSRMQESGRNALEVIGKAVRQAGAITDARILTGDPFTGTALAGVDNTGTPDTITVQYEAQTGGETGCDGVAVASGLMTFAFAVDGTTLTCNGTVVVDNVEDMQVSYGLDPERDGTISEYKSNLTTAEFTQVASVRVNLLVRGPSDKAAANSSQTYVYDGETITSTDGYLRQQYSATFAVRNYSW
jgi:type IV pilus assembly protein PilW